MALERSWQEWLENAGLAENEAKIYAISFADNRVDPSFAPDLTKDLLKEMGVTVIGDIMNIMRYASPDTKPRTSHAAHVKPSVKMPELRAEMTHPEFRKFKVDWDVYKTMSQPEPSQIPAQLYNICDSSVQNSIVNTCSDFFKMEEEEIINLLEKIVTKRSNPAIHRMTFSNLMQAENESISEFVVRLNSQSRDCEYSCPNCQQDLSPIYMKDQLIRGLTSKTLQADILAKEEVLRTLEETVKFAEAHEAAIRDQQRMQQSSEQSELMRAQAADLPEAMAAQFQRQSNRPGGNRQSYRPRNPNNRRDRNSCSGCGNATHEDRENQCPAWGRTCNNCGTPNHFAAVCRHARRDSASASAIFTGDIIAHVTYDTSRGSFTTVSGVKDVTEIPATMKPVLSNKSLEPKELLIFPDSGASICLAGPHHISKLSLKTSNLIPCHKKVMAVGGSPLSCKG